MQLRLSSLVAAAVLAAVPDPSFAQESGTSAAPQDAPGQGASAGSDQDDDVPVTLVTARKRRQPIEDVPRA